MLHFDAAVQAIVYAVALLAVILALGLAADVGERSALMRELQDLADAATHAAAVEGNGQVSPENIVQSFVADNWSRGDGTTVRIDRIEVAGTDLLLALSLETRTITAMLLGHGATRLTAHAKVEIVPPDSVSEQHGYQGTDADDGASVPATAWSDDDGQPERFTETGASDGIAPDSEDHAPLDEADGTDSEDESWDSTKWGETAWDNTTWDNGQHDNAADTEDGPSEEPLEELPSANAAD